MLILAEQNRTFGYAAAASVAVHAFLLAVHAPAMRETIAPPAEPPLVAHIVEAAPPSPPQKEEVPQKEERREAKPRPPVVGKRIQKPRLKPVPRPAPAIAPPAAAVAEPKEERPKDEQPGEAEQPPAAPAPAAPPAVAAIAPSAPAPAPDPAEALASFREQIREVAGRYKRYPPVARDNGWTGGVVVRIEMAASGQVASIRVKTSSGYEVLDEQALEMFRKAVPAVAVPAALRGKEFGVEVRAIYDLQDRPG